MGDPKPFSEGSSSSHVFREAHSGGCNAGSSAGSSLTARAVLGEPRALRLQLRVGNGRDDRIHLQGLLLKEFINPPTALSVVSAEY